MVFTSLSFLLEREAFLLSTRKNNLGGLENEENCIYFKLRLFSFWKKQGLLSSAFTHDVEGKPKNWNSLNWMRRYYPELRLLYIYPVGEFQSIIYGSSGKSILAYLRESEVDEIFRKGGCRKMNHWKKHAEDIINEALEISKTSRYSAEWKF